MKRFTLIAVLLLASASFAQTRPARTEIRRGIEMPTTDRASRQEMIAEQIARKIEPSLKGDVSRLQTYLEFFKRESVRDPRVMACDISASLDHNGAIVLSGYVEYPAHRQAIVLLLRTLGFEHIQEAIKDVPGSQLPDLRFGVVKRPHAFLHDRPTTPRENVTECLFGEIVFLLRATEDGYYWVHNSDGYVGYVAADSIEPISEKQLAGYQASKQVTLRTEVKTPLGYLPPGARLLWVANHGDSVECESFLKTKLTIPASAIAETGGTAAMQKIEGAILAASKLMGTKYVWGGRTAEGIDCSGLTQMAYKSQGINLPRDADQQSQVGRFVATNWYRQGMARGDLMFFISRRGTIAHVAIYLGDNKFLESADGGVKISSMNPKDDNYESKREMSFAFARRIIE